MASTPPPSREEQEAYPPFVVSVADKQRWELSVRAALIIYGYEPGQALTGDDMALVRQSARTLWFDRNLDAGASFVSVRERELMREMGVL